LPHFVAVRQLGSPHYLYTHSTYSTW